MPQANLLRPLSVSVPFIQTECVYAAHTDFGQDEHDRLEDDEDPVQVSPKGSARLIGDGAVSG